VIWSENKKYVALVCDDVTYILRSFINNINEYLEHHEENDPEEEGCENAFEAFFEINDNILSGFFIDDIFVYLNNKNKINYGIEEKIFNITTLDSNYYLLGYLQNVNKIYFMNKNFKLISYTFPLSFVNYQMAILRQQFDQARKV
jgi:uncharacterized protein YsxB (DUF464 family)